MPSLSPEIVRSDLSALYSNLREAHYDLYAHRSKREYDRYYRELWASVRAPMGPVAASILFQKFVAYGRIGHARIDAPVAGFVSNVRSGGKMLPLFIRVDDGRVILTDAAEETGTLRPGTEVLAIDGVPIRQVLARLAIHVSAERPYMVHAQMEKSFPALLWIEHGPVDSAVVTARIAGKRVEVQVKAVTLEQRRALAAKFRAGPAIDLSTREYKALTQGVAYLRPGPFFNTGQAAGNPAPSYEASGFRSFIDDSFRKILASGATDLLIDLRDNPGGDNSFSDPMIAWFADRPFRFASSFRLKASAATKAEYARRRASGESIDPDLERQMATEAGQANGTQYRYELPMVSPRAELRFRGRVWVLVNRHSYSNAASVAALIQDYGFGKVIGEETADVASNYASVQHFTLPATGVTVTYPKSHFVRPNGRDEVAGVKPDFHIARPPVTAAEDVALSAALGVIESRRAR